MSKNRFRNFKVTNVRVDHKSQAYRYALSNLTGARGVFAADEFDKLVISATARLQEQWRARVWGLRSLGWGPAGTPAGLISTMNCPPVGVFTNQPGLRRCKNYWVCPFCWCRQQIDSVFARVTEAISCPAHDWDLVEVITTRKHPREDWAPQAIYDWVRHSKDTYLREYIPEAKGAFVLCTIEPPDIHSEKKQPFYTLRHRVLAVVLSQELRVMPPEEVVAKDGVLTKRTVKRTLGLTKEHLGAVIGRVCMYPRAMLTGDIKETVRLLELRAPGTVNQSGKSKRAGGVRMSGFYGILRRRAYSPD